MVKVTADYLVANSLMALNPKLAEEWHPSKNGSLTPRDVTSKSGKKAWWICSNGHEWEAVITSRTRGNSCPFCIGRRATKDHCLSVVNPRASEEWHPTKNGSLTPSDVTPRSHRRVWWLCRNRHEWQQTIHSRRGSGCPYCAGQKATSDTCLSVVNPLLAHEWHPTRNGSLSPKDVLPQSNKKVWWRCKRGHEWEATVAKRTDGTGCPYCYSQSSQLELAIYCEMKYLLGDVQHRRRLGSVECDVYVPKLNVGIEVDGLLWHKDTFAQDKRKELLLEDRGITLIRVRQEGLRRVSELDVFFSKRDSHLAVLKNIVRKMMGRFPSDVHTNDAMGKYLKRDRMANEEEYKQLLYTLPFPSANLSFKAQYPKIAREWHPTKNGSLTPELVTPMSGQKVWWSCRKGHEWEAVISNRAKGFGCPYCAGQRATEENCLSVLNPLLSRQWHPSKNGRLTPCDVTGSSGKKVWWICPRGHEWKATVAHRAAGNGCPYCSGRVASKDNCLLKANPALADEWHPTRNGGLTPELVTPRSGQKVWWLCRSGHEWQALIYNRAKGVGCPYCAGQKACPENCLQHFNPELSSEWLHSKNGRLTPADVTPGSNRKVWWICQEGHEWEASVSNRNRGTGCPYCSGRRAKTI